MLTANYSTARQGRKKTHARLPGASKFCSRASENSSSVAQWASEISLTSLGSLNKNVSLVNDNFQSEAHMYKVSNHRVESMD